MDLSQETGIKLCCILVVLLLALGLNLQPSIASTESTGPLIGIGGEFTRVILGQEVFYPNLSIGIGNFGADFGGNSVNFQYDDSYDYNSMTYSVSTNASLGFYLASLKYYFRTNGLIRPRWGVGLVNISLNGQGEVTRIYDSNQSSQEFDVSANIGGYNFQVGVDLPLRSFNIPLVIVAGVNHYHFHSLDIDASMASSYTGLYGGGFEDKIEETINYSLTFFNYHFGLRYEF